MPLFNKLLREWCRISPRAEQTFGGEVGVLGAIYINNDGTLIGGIRSGSAQMELTGSSLGAEKPSS